MYEDAAEELKRILALVETCPEPLRQAAFEILLKGYVQSLSPAPRQAPLTAARAATQGLSPPAPAADQDWAAAIAAEVLPRFKAMAKRKGISADRLASLFDFSSDPFAFAPLHVPGTGKSDRAKKVALLVGGRSFLASGRWVADWAEIKAMCTHQNCYDQANFAATLSKEKGGLFKAVEVGTSVELSAAGTEQAESLIAEMANPDAPAK